LSTELPSGDYASLFLAVMSFMMATVGIAGLMNVRTLSLIISVSLMLLLCGLWYVVIVKC
jgi:hypothetical protein